MISNVTSAARPACVIHRRIFAAEGGRGVGTHLHRGLRWFMDSNLVRSRALVALTLVKLCKSGRCRYLRTPGCAAEPLAKLPLAGLRKFSTACMNPKAL